MRRESRTKQELKKDMRRIYSVKTETAACWPKALKPGSLLTLIATNAAVDAKHSTVIGGRLSMNEGQMRHPL